MGNGVLYLSTSSYLQREIPRSMLSFIKQHRLVNTEVEIIKHKNLKTKKAETKFFNRI